MNNLIAAKGYRKSRNNIQTIATRYGIVQIKWEDQDVYDEILRKEGIERM